MFFAMNRFQIVLGHEEAFERMWIERDKRLNEVPGFVAFNLLKGAENKEGNYRQYVSHTTWASYDDFVGWTKSENFRAAHKNAGSNKDMYLGPPVFEGFEPVEGA